MDGRDSEYMSITSENLSDVETLDKNAETYIYGYFKDIRVRKAISLLFNFESLNKAMFYNEYYRLISKKF